MPKRSKDQVLQSFHRLYDVAEAYVDAWRHTLTETEARILDQSFVSRDEMLSWVETRKCSASQIERGVVSALSDFKHGFKDKVEIRSEKANMMSERYLRLRGLPFLEDLDRTLKDRSANPSNQTHCETST